MVNLKGVTAIMKREKLIIAACLALLLLVAVSYRAGINRTNADALAADRRAFDQAQLMKRNRAEANDKIYRLGQGCDQGQIAYDRLTATQRKGLTRPVCE